MKNIILVAETGSDIPPEVAGEYGIHIVPMHVSFGDETRDDGTFPPEEICAYYEKTGALPKTSGSTPEAHILYLAYAPLPRSQELRLSSAFPGRFCCNAMLASFHTLPICYVASQYRSPERYWLAYCCPLL